MAEDAANGPAYTRCGHTRSARRRNAARSGIPRAEERHDAAAGAHRRLHGFLLIVSPRAQRRHDAARPRERADAELEASACRLSRPRKLDRAERHRGAAPAWTDQ